MLNLFEKLFLLAYMIKEAKSKKKLRRLEKDFEKLLKKEKI